jgi:predicted Zn finger-like uncharacterized protein
MLLATRCPHCETVFRLQEAQLALRGGLVRCGHCQSVFNASENLVDPPVGEKSVEGGASAEARSASAEARSAPAESRIAPAEVQSAPAESRIAPAESRIAPAEAQSAPVESQSAPAESQIAPAESDSNPVEESHSTPIESRSTLPEPVAEAPAAALAASHASDEHVQPEPDFRGSAWDTWAPVADTRIDPAPHLDADAVTPPLVTPGTPQPVSLHPEPEHASVQVAEPMPTRPAPHEAPRDAALSSIASGGAREPSFTAWPGPEMRAEPESPASAFAAERGDEPTLQNATASSWDTDPEPSFGSVGTGTPAAAEPSSADAARASATAPFAAEPAAQSAQRFTVVREERAPEGGRVVWRVVGAIVALVLAVLLVAQLAWWRRETVMVYWPGSQPWFADVCGALGCQISPPRDIDGLQVEASDLRQVDGPHRLELRVPLRNRYNIALAYPALELTLLDDKNNIALRRVLWPQDYAPPGTAIAAGLPARATQTMIVRLDTGNAVASNFRVQIFYP